MDAREYSKVLFGSLKENDLVSNSNKKRKKNIHLRYQNDKSIQLTSTQQSNYILLQ